MGNVARRLTQHIRGNGQDMIETSFWETPGDKWFSNEIKNHTTHAETSGMLATLSFHIEWGWISLPVALVFLSGMPILLTMLDTKKKQIPVFGGSNLALIIHGADDDTRRLLMEHEADVDSVDRIAGGTQVRLTGEHHVLTAMNPHSLGVVSVQSYPSDQRDADSSLSPDNGTKANTRYTAVPSSRMLRMRYI